MRFHIWPLIYSTIRHRSRNSSAGPDFLPAKLPLKNRVEGRPPLHLTEEEKSVDTYLLIALNNLLDDLLAPLATASAPSTSFGSVLNKASGTSSPTGSTNVNQALASAAQSTGLSPALLKAVATVESGLNPGAVSSAGAVGLMQLMPKTAAALGVDPESTAQNALGGAEYLKSLLGEFHQNLSLAVAAYNAGPCAVNQYGGIPPYQQTDHYVRAVLTQYQANLSPTPSGSSSTE